MRKVNVAPLLSFNGEFLDTAGFLGLQGLFTAHVTGNFVTLGAALVFGTHGVVDPAAESQLGWDLAQGPLRKKVPQASERI
jgi:hypothetical protein